MVEFIDNIKDMNTNSEQPKELFEAGQVNLRVRADGSQIFFEFDAKTVKQATAYNQAISLVLDREGANPTPHTAFERTLADQIGYQNWETWAISEKRAKELLEEIEAEAERIFNRS